MSVRRSPTAFKQLLPYAKINGGHQIYPTVMQQQQHASMRSGCIRWMRFLLPLLFVAVLSSYTTYLILYQTPRTSFVEGDEAHLAANSQSKPSSVVDLDTAALAAAAAASAAAAEASTAIHRTAGHVPSGDAQAAAPNKQNTIYVKSGQPPPLAPTDAASRWLKATGRRMTVAIVNEAPYHFEIVAGFLHVLGELPVDVTWYQAGQKVPEYTAVDLIEMVGFAKLLGYMPRMRQTTVKPDPTDFAVFISPEYFEKETLAFLEAAKPITAVMLGHNGMNHALQRIQAFDHPRLHFAALAPHVAAASRQVLHIHTHWMMATWPFVSKHPCTVDSRDAASCLDGFSIQGNFETARRNYTRIWTQMADARASQQLPTAPPVKPFNLHLLGRGDVKTLGIPEAVANMTSLHLNLRFSEYYDQIHHTHALLMLLASNNYLLQKMSSTVVSSLMTGTPIIADSKVLKSYTFLKPEHVYLMAEGETEMDVMQRILRMPSAEVFAVRRRVFELAEHLNRRTLQVLQTFMPMEEDARGAPVVVLKKN